MAYDILSIGDAEMLYNTFNGAAMIFASDNMRTLIKIGFLIGVFLVGFHYYFEMKFPLYSVLVGFIVYSLMFTPKDTVVIEDVYTGQVYTVANVPIGIALPMSVVSTIGVNTTKLYETAFSIPDEAGLLQAGYLEPLDTLVKLRNIGLGTASSDISFNGNLSDSLNGYIEGCVMFDLELQVPASEHEVTREKLLKADDLWAAMKTTFINKDVLVDLPTFSGQKSCQEAYVLLDQYLNTPEFGALWEQYLHGFLDIKDTAVTSDEVVTQATQALGMVSVDFQNYMRNALMAAYLRDGPAAFIARTGMEQLKLQWSGERTIFNQIARPLMAFVEVFTVAISPIVAFLTTLGIMGIAMIARYFQMLIWVALWGPIMAVCNLYIAIVTTRIMTALADQAQANGASLSAMVSHDKLYDTLETWLATGGMLASSVPALSLMLVYGGSVAATNLAGKMTAGASSAVKPERLMPEPVSMGTVTNIGSQRDYSANMGQTKSAMTENTFSLASSTQKARQSALSSLTSANASASQAFNNLTQHTDSNGQTVTDGTTITDSLSKSNSQTDRWAAATGRAIADKVGRTDAEKEAIAASASTQLTLGASAGVFKTLTFGGEAGLKSDGGISASRQQEISDQMNKTWQSEHANINETRSAHDFAKAHSDQSMFASQEMKAKGENYISQLQRVDQAQKAYSASVTDSQTAGKSLPMKYSELSAKLVASGAQSDLANADRDIMINGTDKEKAAYQEARDHANTEISNSAAQPAPDHRAALTTFLALDEVRPQQAVGIAKDHLMPTSGGMDTGISTGDQFNQDAKSPDEIVSKQQANEFDLNAKGSTRLSSEATQSVNTVPARMANTTSAKDNIRHAPRSTPSATDDSVSGATRSSQTVNDALNGGNLGSPDKFRHRITDGPLIPDDKDTSHLMGGALKHEGHAFYDNTVVSGERSLGNIGEKIGGAVFDTEQAIKGVLGIHSDTETPIKQQKHELNDELPDIKK